MTVVGNEYEITNDEFSLVWDYLNRLVVDFPTPLALSTACTLGNTKVNEPYFVLFYGKGLGVTRNPNRLLTKKEIDCCIDLFILCINYNFCEPTQAEISLVKDLTD